jgi:hypothetical protein
MFTDHLPDLHNNQAANTQATNRRHEHVAFHADFQTCWLGQYKIGGQSMTTSEPFDFAKHMAQLNGEPTPRLPSPRTAESNDGEKSAGNLSDLLGQVSKNSKVEIDSLINELQQLRRKLQTDGDRIRREIEEYHALSQQVMQLTSIISDSVAQLPTAHTSVDSGRTH